MVEDKKVDYTPDELLPPKGSEDVGYAVAKMLSEIFTYREDEKIAEKCNRHYKMKRNRHWKYKDKELNLLSANLCGSHHKKTVNMLTANKPTFDIVPNADLSPEELESLSLQKHTADSWWIDTEQQEVYRESCDSGELYGTVGEFGYFDLDVNFPDGDVSFDTLDLLYMSMYPPECRKLRKAEAFLRWYPMSVRKARREWPDKAADIVGDMSLLEDIGDERNEDHQSERQSITQIIISSVTKFISGETKKGEITDTDKLFIIEAWVKDYSEKNGMPVYPGNIRRVITCNAGAVVLGDEYNPSLNQKLGDEILQANYLYNRFPASYIQPVPDNSSPFGLSDFEQLEKLNMELNKAVTQYSMFKDSAARLKFRNPKNSGVTNEELNNESGIVRPTNHLVSAAMDYINPPTMGSDIPGAISLFKDLFNEVAGSFSDVTQGQKAGSEVIAAKAIALLLETEARQVQGKADNYNKMLRERGRIYLALAQMWYDKPRYVNFEKEGEQITKGVTSQELRVPGRVNVISGSTMPKSDIQRREEALSLAAGGWIDQQELLKKLEWDNIDDLVTRMQQGPIGQYLQKLGLIGVPEQILKLFSDIGKIDEKQLEKGVKEGQIPPFMELMKKMLGQQQQQPDPQAQKEQMEVQLKTQTLQLKAKELEMKVLKTEAEVKEKDAKIQELAAKVRETEAKTQKVVVETELVTEEIKSEVVDRELSIEGLALDKDNMLVQKAEAISRIENADKAQKMGEFKTVSDVAGQRDKMNLENASRNDKGGYDERKMKSNNKDK